MTTRVPLVALIILTFAFVYPFLFTIAGDAQVHLVVSENFASGYPFQYDRTGEIGMASTSPFWTMMLTFFFWLTGHWTPILLKVDAIFFQSFRTSSSAA